MFLLFCNTEVTVTSVAMNKFVFSTLASYVWTNIITSFSIIQNYFQTAPTNIRSSSFNLPIKFSKGSIDPILWSYKIPRITKLL